MTPARCAHRCVAACAVLALAACATNSTSQRDIPAEERDVLSRQQRLSSVNAEFPLLWDGEILRRLGADPNCIRRVADCVRRHRYRGAARPVSREAKLLFDADKLDSLGAVGIGRAFLFAGEVGARLHNTPAAARRAQDYGPGDTAYREWLVKLRHLPGRLLTAAGRRMAADRAAFAAAFFERLDGEVAGER